MPFSLFDTFSRLHIPVLPHSNILTLPNTYFYPRFLVQKQLLRTSYDHEIEHAEPTAMNQNYFSHERKQTGKNEGC